MKVTKRAKDHIKNSLSQVRSTTESESCFRIVRDGDAFRIEVGEPGKADETVAVDGEVILAVEPGVARQCEEMTLDVDRSGGSSALVFVPPLEDPQG